MGNGTDCFDPVPRIQCNVISEFAVRSLDSLQMISVVNSLQQGCLPLLSEHIGEVCDLQRALQEKYRKEVTMQNPVLLLPTVRITVLMEKLVHPQLAKKFPHIMETQNSLTSSHQPANRPCLAPF